MIDISTTDYVISKIDLDIVEAACVVTSLAIEKEPSIFSSIVDQVSSQGRVYGFAKCVLCL